MKQILKKIVTNGLIAWFAFGLPATLWVAGVQYYTQRALELLRAETGGFF